MSDQITPERIAELRRWTDAHQHLSPSACREVMDALIASRAEVQRLTEEARRSAPVQAAEIPLLDLARNVLGPEHGAIPTYLSGFRREDHGALLSLTMDAIRCGIEYGQARRSDAGRVEVPRWEDVDAKLQAGESLNPLEDFIHSNEPAIDDENGTCADEVFRTELKAALDWVASRLSPSPQPATEAVPSLTPRELENILEGSTEINDLCEVLNGRFRSSPQPSADVVVPSWLVLAGIGRKHFGNPIPQAWYAAARELVDSLRSSTNHDSKETP